MEYVRSYSEFDGGSMDVRNCDLYLSDMSRTLDVPHLLHFSVEGALIVYCFLCIPIDYPLR